MKMGRSLVLELSLLVSVLDSLSLFWLLLLLRVSKRNCLSTISAPPPFSHMHLNEECGELPANWDRIDDRKSANPRMRGFLHGSKIIFQERGIRGFFQGFVPTTARQAANSATRFTAYTTLRQFAEGYVAPGEKLGALSTFGIGGLAGIITV